MRKNNDIERGFQAADVALWVDPDGRVTNVKIINSTGDRRVDAELVGILGKIRLSRPPPATYRFPQKIRVRGQV